MCHFVRHFVCHHDKNGAIKKLTIRNGIYYYRSKQISGTKAKDIRISLHTTDFFEAVTRMKIEDNIVTLQKQLAKLETKLLDSSTEPTETVQLLETKQAILKEIADLKTEREWKSISASIKKHSSNVLKPHLPTEIPASGIPVLKPSNINIVQNYNNTTAATNIVYPTIRAMLDEFEEARGYVATNENIKEYKKNHKYKIHKLYERLFGLGVFDLEQPISILNDVTLLNKWFNKIAATPRSKNSPETIGIAMYAKYLLYTRVFLEYCNTSNQSYITAKTLSLIQIPEVKSSDTIPHTPYSEQSLKTMFNPAKSKEFFIEYSYLFWAIVISLFSGSRKNAATTLMYKDIRKIKGIDSISFIEEKNTNKSYKNDATSRKIPMAPQLIKLGFIEWVNNRKKFLNAKNTDYIFPECTIRFSETPENNGKYAEACLRPLFDHFIKIGIKHSDWEKVKETREKFDFHSFRKNANQILQKHKVTTANINLIIGWDSENMSDREYNHDPLKDETVEYLKDIVDNNLKYDFLDEEFAQWKDIMKDTYKYTGERKKPGKKKTN